MLGGSTYAAFIGLNIGIEQLSLEVFGVNTSVTDLIEVMEDRIYDKGGPAVLWLGLALISLLSFADLYDKVVIPN